MSDGHEYEDFRCTVYSSEEDRPGALLLLAMLDPLIEVTGPEEYWQRIVMFNSAGRMTFTAMTRLDEGFAMSIAEVQQKFGAVRTDAVAAKERVLDAFRECQLIVEVTGEPLVRRLDQMGPVIGLASYLKGLICTGTQVADSKGNLILDILGISSQVPNEETHQ